MCLMRRRIVARLTGHESMSMKCMKFLVPFGVICEIEGSGVRQASEQELLKALNEVDGMPFSHPWKKKAEEVARCHSGCRPV